MTPTFRDRLLRGERLAGTLLSLPVPELAEIASLAGFDWLFLDMEHGSIEISSLVSMIQAVRGPCASVVRVPENKEMWMKKALDAGADGVIIPRVNSPEEAASAVFWAKYPPQGGRSVGFSRANAYGTRFQEHVDTANERAAVIIQIEHVDGARRIEEILSVPGVDAIFVGPYDLSASFGKPGEVGDPQVREAILSVREACALRHVPAGIFCGDIPAAAKAVVDEFSRQPSNPPGAGEALSPGSPRDARPSLPEESLDSPG
jgi:2-keto-3-deoxy-L-rhamnonate aldolase RhmA